VEVYAALRGETIIAKASNPAEKEGDKALAKS
jgi:hypothetical protein